MSKRILLFTLSVATVFALALSIFTANQFFASANGKTTIVPMGKT